MRMQIAAGKDGVSFSPCLGKRGARGTRPRIPAGICRERGGATSQARARADCLEQLLEAVRDILDRDDIHQAASRLAMVQEWIRREAESAAADPIFAEPPAG